MKRTDDSVWHEAIDAQEAARYPARRHLASPVPTAIAGPAALPLHGSWLCLSITETAERVDG